MCIFVNIIYTLDLQIGRSLVNVGRAMGHMTLISFLVSLSELIVLLYMKSSTLALLLIVMRPNGVVCVNNHHITCKSCLVNEICEIQLAKQCPLNSISICSCLTLYPVNDHSKTI